MRRFSRATIRAVAWLAKGILLAVCATFVVLRITANDRHTFVQYTIVGDGPGVVRYRQIGGGSSHGDTWISWGAGELKVSDDEAAPTFRKILADMRGWSTGSHPWDPPWHSGVASLTGFAGFGRWRTEGSFSVHRYSGDSFAAPLWALATASGAWPTISLLRAARRQLRERRRRGGGRCPACGYDLRATPDRCPECGTTPALARSQ